MKGVLLLLALTVLEGTKPKQDEVHRMAARRKDDLVQDRKVEPVLFRLNHLPRHAAQQGVDVGVGHLLPDRRHVFGGRQGRVLELAASNQKGLALDDELF
jgi:hypothetical protein